MDTQAAIERRDTGIALSVEKADRQRSGWSKRAYIALLKYLVKHKEPFLVESMREWAEQNNHIDAPENGRAWGSVVRHAFRQGVIGHAGYGLAKSSNLSPKVMWKRI
jgi:hypothetical protein